MTEPSSHEVTQLLLAWSDEDQSALEKLTPLVYAELHKNLAHGHGENHTLQATALVNEAYLRLIDEGDMAKPGALFRHRRAAYALDLVDFARRRQSSNAAARPSSSAGGGRGRGARARH